MTNDKVAPETFGTCADCGATGDDFEIEAFTFTSGLAGMRIEPNPEHEGAWIAEHTGDTEMIWDDSYTTSFRCAACGKDLPEAEQRYLSELMDEPIYLEPKRDVRLSPLQ